jgi:hypothetical protein
VLMMKRNVKFAAYLPAKPKTGRDAANNSFVYSYHDLSRQIAYSRNPHVYSLWILPTIVSWSLPLGAARLARALRLRTAEARLRLAKPVSRFTFNTLCSDDALMTDNTEHQPCSPSCLPILVQSSIDLPNVDTYALPDRLGLIDNLTPTTTQVEIQLVLRGLQDI